MAGTETKEKHYADTVYQRRPVADAKDGVIPAPYALEEGEQIIDQYLEPVIFHNVNGPDIGVTTCGVIVKDGLYFKDLDNSGELAPYKDWRLSLSSALRIWSSICGWISRQALC